jgi:hypothetical protein
MARIPSPGQQQGLERRRRGYVTSGTFVSISERQPLPWFPAPNVRLTWHGSAQFRVGAIEDQSADAGDHETQCTELVPDAN